MAGEAHLAAVPEWLPHLVERDLQPDVDAEEKLKAARLKIEGLVGRQCRRRATSTNQEHAVLARQIGDAQPTLDIVDAGVKTRHSAVSNDEVVEAVAPDTDWQISLCIRQPSQQVWLPDLLIQKFLS